MSDYIEISGLISTSCADGPGLRTVLFVQGCSKGCRGCHNKKAQPKGQGRIYEVDELIDKIKGICLNKKITISGGEPMEQYDSVLLLIKKLTELDFNICLYTGLEINDVPEEIFNYIDYIKVGEFINELKDTTLAFRGSGNQKIYRVNRGKGLCLEEAGI